MTATFQDSDSSGPPREGEKVIASGVLAAVDRALDVAKEERLRYLEGCVELDAAGRQTAERLLRECERCEELDRVAVASEEGPVRDALDRAPFVLDLAALVAEAEADGSASRRLAAETRLGPYRVVRFVAAGGMGEVYEALDERVGRRVAVKVLPATASEERASRFAREAIVMGRLEHPAIARLYESGRARQGGGKGAALDYIAMEFIEGIPLAEAATKVREAHRDDPRLLVELLLPIVDAVAYAHARGVLHRDIKPANILVESGGEAVGKARLLDFGVASLLGPDEQLAMTATGDASRPGTLAYMSPEQIRGGSARVTTQSDVYALGLVLHEAIRGAPVIDPSGKGIADVIEEVLQRDPPRLFQPARRELADLELVIRKALSKEPRDRYRSVDALAEDLRRVCLGEPPRGRDVGAMEMLGRLAWRHRKAMAAGAAVVVALGFVAAIGASQFVRAREAEARSEVLIGQLLEGSKPLIHDLHQRLLAEDQPLAARKAVLEATAAYLEWVQASSADDERVLLEVSDSYRRLAAVAGSAAQGSLGETALAFDYFGRSRAILDQLLDLDAEDAGHISVDLRPQLLFTRSGVLQELASLCPREEQGDYFALAIADQRAGVELMEPGAARDSVEIEFLFTNVKWGLVVANTAALETSLARLRTMAEEPRLETDADFMSKLGMAERYYVRLLEYERRPEDSLRAARAAQAALERSIALGYDDFTNRRHLAWVELVVAARTANKRAPRETVGFLFAALERSRSATNLDPTDSLHRASHIEVLVQFGSMAQLVAEHARDLAATNGAAVSEDPRELVERLLAAIDENVAFATSLPTEGAPNPVELRLLEDVAAARESLARVLDTIPLGTSAAP